MKDILSFQLSPEQIDIIFNLIILPTKAPTAEPTPAPFITKSPTNTPSDIVIEQSNTDGSVLTEDDPHPASAWFSENYAMIIILCLLGCCLIICMWWCLRRNKKQILIEIKKETTKLHTMSTSVAEADRNQYHHPTDHEPIIGHHPTHPSAVNYNLNRPNISNKRRRGTNTMQTDGSSSTTGSSSDDDDVIGDGYIHGRGHPPQNMYNNTGRNGYNTVPNQSFDGAEERMTIPMVQPSTYINYNPHKYKIEHPPPYQVMLI